MVLARVEVFFLDVMTMTEPLLYRPRLS